MKVNETQLLPEEKKECVAIKNNQSQNDRDRNSQSGPTAREQTVQINNDQTKSIQIRSSQSQNIRTARDQNKDSRNKYNQKLAILAGVIFLLFICTPIASDPPEEPKPIFLSSAIKVTPEMLNYENMLTGAPRATTLTITNVSDNDISITPSMGFSESDAAFLDSKLEVCGPETCSPVTSETKISILKGEYQEVVVTVTLTDASKDMSSFSIAGDLQVIGEVLNK